MKLAKGLLIVLAMAVVVVGVTHSAFGFGSETATGTWFDQPGVLDPDAEGTEVKGTMTIFYQLYDPFTLTCETVVDETGEHAIPNATMFVFLRLKKDGDTQEYGFSTRTEVCVIDFPAQKAAVDEYLAGCVVPGLFPDKPKAKFALKSVSRYVTDDPFAFSEETTCANLGIDTPMFVMVDVVMAVKDKKPPRQRLFQHHRHGH